MNLCRIGLRLALVGAVCTASLTGCASVPGDEVAATASTLLATATPLPTLPPSSPIGISPPDCSGHLGGEVTFAVVSLSAGLVAAVDASGHVVCVDSVGAVQSDLDASGRESEAAALVAGFTAAAHQADGRDARFAGRALPGDPEPQPNMDPARLPDPEPQPN
jgi:hypothetical protein